MSASQPHGQRTHTCGELRMAHVGTEVVLKGWVDTRRNLGGIIFIDLRDRYGLTQIVIPPQNGDVYAQAEKLRGEWVISAKGTVRERESKNAGLPTGDIEVYVDSLEVLSEAEPLPFVVSAHEERELGAGEDLRLKYRYLDLRRPTLQQKLLLRHKFYQVVRQYFDEHNFVEVETPVLMKSTPEGARDYLVPSRVHPGHFYALPQSPQTYKQILMIAGMDRYFQIVKCFRDEDLRADRQPEFTQIDVEMTFATEEGIFEMVEGLLKRAWKELKGIEIETPIPRLSYDEAIRRYGSDKPDTRFSLEITDLSGVFQNTGFRVFDSVLGEGGAIVAITVPGLGDSGRGYLDKLDKGFVRSKLKAGGLFYIKVPSDGSGPVASVKEEVLSQAFVDQAVQAANAGAGDLVLILAGPQPKVFEQMGSLRLHMAKEQNLIPENQFAFLWVTEFPLLEYDEETGRYYAMHHPFTSPRPEDLPHLFERPGDVRARAYDLVLNGYEIAGGSIRIHRRDVQQQMFKLLGIGEEEAQERFGFLLDAFRYGAPPHGGIAFGLDRMVMLLAGTQNIRDVIAFPKTQQATEPMSNTPDTVGEEQLQELHIRVVPPVEGGDKTDLVKDPT